MITESLYEILGVKSTASLESIRAAYYQLAKEKHPDLNNGIESPEFLEITRAYRILSNPELRQQYDATGVAYEVNPEEQEINSQLIMHFESAIQEMDLFDDLIDVMVRVLGRSVFQAEQNVIALQAEQTVKDRISKRLKTKDGKKNFLGMILQEQLDRIADGIAGQKRLVECLKKTRERLHDYVYEDGNLALSEEGKRKNAKNTKKSLPFFVHDLSDFDT